MNYHSNEKYFDVNPSVLEIYFTGFLKGAKYQLNNYDVLLAVEGPFTLDTLGSIDSGGYTPAKTDEDSTVTFDSTKFWQEIFNGTNADYSSTMIIKTNNEWTDVELNRDPWQMFWEEMIKKSTGAVNIKEAKLESELYNAQTDNWLNTFYEFLSNRTWNATDSPYPPDNNFNAKLFFAMSDQNGSVAWGDAVVVLPFKINGEGSANGALVLYPKKTIEGGGKGAYILRPELSYLANPDELLLIPTNEGGRALRDPGCKSDSITGISVIYHDLLSQSQTQSSTWLEDVKAEITYKANLTANISSWLTQKCDIFNLVHMVFREDQYSKAVKNLQSASDDPFITHNPTYISNGFVTTSNDVTEYHAICVVSVPSTQPRTFDRCISISPNVFSKSQFVSYWDLVLRVTAYGFQQQLSTFKIAPYSRISLSPYLSQNSNGISYDVSFRDSYFDLAYDGVQCVTRFPDTTPSKVISYDNSKTYDIHYDIDGIQNVELILRIVHLNGVYTLSSYNEQIELISLAEIDMSRIMGTLGNDYVFGIIADRNYHITRMCLSRSPFFSLPDNQLVRRYLNGTLLAEQAIL